MAMIKLLVVSGLVIFGLQGIDGHGKMVDPSNRSSAYRLRRWDDQPENVQDNENFCGGFNVQYTQNGGKCGPCGDNYADPQPRGNENGGLYGRGHVVKTYKAGETIKVVVDLSANHMGHFEFSICKLANATAIETEECFQQYRLKLKNSKGELSDKYEVGSLSGEVTIDVHLPKDLVCDRCVMRWHYRCGNNWGWCEEQENGEKVGRLGCGDQEMFRSCADISIH